LFEGGEKRGEFETRVVFGLCELNVMFVEAVGVLRK
jgi:hypothetical protein